MRGRVGEQRLLGVEVLVLVGIVEAGAVELVELERQQVELARTGALVPAELHEGLVDARQLGSGGPERTQVDARVAVEGVALGPGAQELLVRVLAVELDEPAAALCQLGPP